jgi:outer membrane protein OmpA-like peptidoglycan-associated protein
MKQVFHAISIGAIWGFAAVPCFAQTLSDAEIADRFRAQLRSIGAAEANPDLGATRGLVLVPVSPTEEAAAAARDPDAPEGGGGGETTLTLTDPETGAEETQAVWTLPPEEQVNVQISFGFDSAALAESQKPKLRRICEQLGAAGVKVLRVVGHTDASGPWDYNQQLSELRAEEVKRFFVGDCGIAEDRLQAVGVGEQFPFDKKKPGASVNRRVEFQAVS